MNAERRNALRGRLHFCDIECDEGPIRCGQCDAIAGLREALDALDAAERRATNAEAHARDAGRELSRELTNQANVLGAGLIANERAAEAVARAEAAERRAAEAEGDTALLREYGEADAARSSHAGAEHRKVMARSIAATEAIEERGRALVLARSPRPPARDGSE